MNLKRQHINRHLQYTSMLLPALIGFSIIVVFPIVVTFLRSVTSWSAYSRTIEFNGFTNYLELFSDKAILIGIKNSLIYAFIMTIIQNILAIIFAIALDRSMKSKNVLRTIIFAPAVLSPIVVGFLWSYLMAPTDYALINNFLSFIGIDSVNWLGNPRLALYSIILTQIWQWTGWAMTIYIANIQSIPGQLYEAASIDGANGLQKIFNITIPQLYPAISFNTVMSLIGGLKVFDIIYAMTKGGPGYSTESIITILLKRAFEEGRYGYASAFAVVFFIIVIIITSLHTKILSRWEEALS